MAGRFSNLEKVLLNIGCATTTEGDRKQKVIRPTNAGMLLFGHDPQQFLLQAEVGEPTQNGYAERLMRTIKEEHVDLTEFVDYHYAYQQIGRFLDEVYMHKRIHSSLGYLTPVEFEGQWRAQQLVAEVTHFSQ